MAQSEGMYFLKRAPRAAQNVVRGRSLPTPALCFLSKRKNFAAHINPFHGTQFGKACFRQHAAGRSLVTTGLEEYTFGRERVHSLLDYVRFNPLR